MQNDANLLLKIIDERIDIKNNKKMAKFPGIITQIIDAGHAKVRIANNDNEISLLNKTGEILSVGDSVYIETINSDLTGGFISERFGTPVLAGGGSGGSMTAGEILASLKTVDGTGSGLDADLLDGQHGTYYLNRDYHTGVQSADTIIDGSTNKVFTSTEKTKLSGIATGANNYTLPVSTPSVLGGIKADGVTITVNSITGVASSIGGSGELINIDGGLPNSNFGGISSINAGGVT